MSTRRAPIDLCAQQVACDMNYLCLLRLLAPYEDFQQRCFTMPVANGGQAQLELVRTERFPYTDTLEVKLDLGLKPWTKRILITARVYRDMCCAEVTRCQHKRLRDFYPYPNEQMFMPDEKMQMNRFFGEWLRYCLAHGGVAFNTLQLNALALESH